MHLIQIHGTHAQHHSLDDEWGQRVCSRRRLLLGISWFAQGVLGSRRGRGRGAFAGLLWGGVSEVERLWVGKVLFVGIADLLGACGWRDLEGGVWGCG